MHPYPCTHDRDSTRLQAFLNLFCTRSKALEQCWQDYQEAVSLGFQTQLVESCKNQFLVEYVRSVNELMIKLDNFSSDVLSDADAFWLDDLTAPPEHFAVAGDKTFTAVKLPPLPVAVYRRNPRTYGEHPIRLPQLRSMLDTVPALVGDGNLLLLILHVIPEGATWRRVPDFDNYDVKWVIDTMLAPYGGDSPANYTLLHSARQSDILSPGTYLLLRTWDGSVDLNHSVRRLEELFSPRKEGTP